MIITEEYAGGEEPHVGRAELEVAACRGQEERHTQDLHRITGVRPPADDQQQPMEEPEPCRQTQTWGPLHIDKHIELNVGKIIQHIKNIMV